MWAGAHNLGEGISFIGTSFLVGWLGWQWGFLGPGIVCTVMAGIMFCLLADRPQTYGLPHIADFKQDYSAGKPSNESVGRLQLQVLKSPLVWTLGLSSALMYVTRYALHSWGPLYLQVAKGYSVVESGMIIGANTAVGFCGAVSSGWVSDRFFQSRRNLPTLLYGLLLVMSLILLYAIPPGHLWLDMVAFGCFEFAIGGLIVFLAGLTAVDIMPKKVAGAVKGLIGLFSYFAAASQDWISGYLIDRTKEMVDGKPVYHFDAAFQFWIGASILSMLLALTVWNAKAAE
jgi:OPA family sugar phosphate sensor protein UhpC-like MFS transporter